MQLVPGSSRKWNVDEQDVSRDRVVTLASVRPRRKRFATLATPLLAPMRMRVDRATRIALWVFVICAAVVFAVLLAGVK